MNLETYWNRCIFMADNEDDWKLLRLLYQSLEEDGRMDINDIKQEVTVHTYY